LIASLTDPRASTLWAAGLTDGASLLVLSLDSAGVPRSFEEAVVISLSPPYGLCNSSGRRQGCLPRPDGGRAGDEGVTPR